MEADIASQLIVLLLAHKYIALVALGIGAVVRLLKSDTKIPIDIPANLRPWVALGLGGLAGMFQLVAQGSTFKEAAITALSAPVLAIVGHLVGIEWMAGGKEIPIPGLMKASAPVSKRTLGAIVFLVLFVPGCTSQQAAKFVDSAVEVADDVIKIARVLCLAEHARQAHARAFSVQDACNTEQKLERFIPQARGMVPTVPRGGACQ